ncbi:uncharacterized protein LOC112466227 [Temnothorax curvispinosus]|uniref:Uncharacterized protein LOC112466227 n=1 Tax=Temnothorax curvispinosus TaxID=300111 RepID=A0A6J1R5S1_9HYME|nr:uncharacterized protein LOC112466227 [Temnothorax curvispinosus]
MDCEIPRDLQMSYLQAIQKIPGDTAGEKWRWIGRLILHQNSKDLEQFPPELLLILHVEIAVKKKKHEEITLALKHENLTIINRAFKASWFFDGSHKEIIDVAYFCERLFPYVSVNTRKRIVITLAHRLSGKDPVFAQQMFTAVASTYGIQTAYPLFMACDNNFVCKMIEEKGFVLPVEFVKKIFYKNPDLVVSFLKLLNPGKGIMTKRTPLAIGINKYKRFLPKLIKRRIEAFVELYEIYRPSIVLSNTCAEIFLKKAKQHLIEKPLIYIRILPLRKINQYLMKSIFPSLLPNNMCDFSTNTMLDYLKYYPHDKKYELLRTSYETKYNANFLEAKNVTPDLLRFLPAEERIKQARIKIGKMVCAIPGDYETAWICYLPANEAIPVIKETINKTADENHRLDLIMQMMYACKINEDDDALSDTLTYVLNRHKNESCHVLEIILCHLFLKYDIPHLNRKQGSLVEEIAKLFHIKHNSIPTEILEALVLFKCIHNMPIEDLLDIMLERNTKFNMLTEYPQYEKQCLITFANLIQKKYLEDSLLKQGMFCRFVVAMYNFNDRCKRSRIEIEKMTIRDYPWLIDVIDRISRDSLLYRDGSFWNAIRVLKLNEPELFPDIREPYSLANVRSGAALALLKRDLQKIEYDWFKYLSTCKENCYHKQVQRFIRAIRWYKDLPIKFAKCCMDEHDVHEISSSMAILAILLHGDVVTKLIDPLIPTKDISHLDDRDSYKLVRGLSLSMRLSNPPVPLDLVVRLLVNSIGGVRYLSIPLMTLTNVSRRTYLPKVISIAQKLTSMSVSVRKHGIRLMYLIASIRELMDFYQKTWTTENHYSIRQVLFKAVQKLFLTEPKPETWSLYCQTMSTLNLKDERFFSEMKLFRDIPDEYVMKYLDLWLKTIDNFQEMGLDVEKINKYTVEYLAMFNSTVSNLLSEEFVENILQRYLFHVNTYVSERARRFLILHIFPRDMDKHAARSKILINVLCKISFVNEDVPQSLKNSHFCLTNKTVRLLINDFVTAYVRTCFDWDTSINSQVIDCMLMRFSSDLSPMQDASSYLRLFYAKTLQECMESSSKESFGLRIGQQLPELINIFSPVLISIMTEILKNLLYHVNDEVPFSIMEGLIEADNRYSCIMAAMMLPSFRKFRQMAKYDQLIEKFRKMQDPTITTVLYNHFYKCYY